MQESPNLDLPYLMPAQAQKHITHNEALARLDALVQLSVIDRDLTTPPGTPGNGDRYIVAAGGSGEWTGWDLSVAAFIEGAWTRLVPKPGWVCWIADEERVLAWDGAAWQPLSAAGIGFAPAGGIAAANLQDAIEELDAEKAALAGAAFGGAVQAPMLGVNATPDAANPFSATVNKALWNALGAGSGGDGDLRFTMNKESGSDVLSVLFQANWSARAEFGLLGNEDLSFKVSPDGANWFDALAINKDDGRVSLPGGLRASTVGSLPSASPAGQILYVSDGASNKRLAISDGADWRWPDGALVS